MRARRLPRLAVAAALAAGPAAVAHAQARPTPPPVPEQPLPPGTPGLPQLPPDSAGAARLASARAAPGRAVVSDAGPGLGGRIARGALAGPHLMIDARDSALVVGRAITLDRTLVVVGDAYVAGTVRGDLVVLGDLYVRPGALVEGRAVAVGGRVAPSALAQVRGGTLSYSELTFEARQTSDGALDLRVSPRAGVAVSTVALPGVTGLRIPAYTRVDGLALTFGPEVRLDTGRVRIEPLVTYRSQLGVVDPGLVATAELTRRTVLELRAARGTFTNDAWIRGDVVNSALALGVGLDVRNYYRADRAQLTATRRFETPSQLIEPFVGALVERSWSAARDSLAPSVPYSLVRRDDGLEGMRRRNPAVTGGRVASALGGVRWRLEADGGARAGAEARLEQALSVQRGARFTQGTFDATATFQGFRDHVVELLGHAVGTLGPGAPSQRWAYVGGSGTIPSLLLLEQGGAQLVWVESRYTVPVRAVRLPLAGNPSVTLRHIVGGAGERRLPALTQNVGIRVVASLVRVDYVLDPSGRGRNTFSAGVGLR